MIILFSITLFTCRWLHKFLVTQNTITGPSWSLLLTLFHSFPENKVFMFVTIVIVKNVKVMSNLMIVMTVIVLLEIKIS